VSLNNQPLEDTNILLRKMNSLLGRQKGWKASIQQSLHDQIRNNCFQQVTALPITYLSNWLRYLKYQDKDMFMKQLQVTLNTAQASLLHLIDCVSTISSIRILQSDK